MHNSKHPKNQHYVPRFILKRFVERKNQVWVYDKQNKSKFKSNIKNIAAEGGFYDFNFMGHDLSYEPSLGDMESAISPIIKKIIKNESLTVVNDDDRLNLSYFLSVQFVRTPQWRRRWEDMHNSFAESLSSRGFSIKDIEGYEEPSNEKTKLHHMRQLQNAQEFTPYFLDKIWVLLRTDKSLPFWTSDNPISLQNINNFGFYGNIGLTVKGIEIYFPISSTLCIGLWCPSLKESLDDLHKKYIFIKFNAPWALNDLPDSTAIIDKLKNGIDTGSPIPSTDENVINHNSLQVKYSSRFVFSSNDDFSLLEEMLEEHPELQEGPKMQIN